MTENEKLDLLLEKVSNIESTNNKLQDNLQNQ